MMCSFKVLFVAGKSNFAADATSRNPPDGPESPSLVDSLIVIRLEPDMGDMMEADVIAGAHAETNSKLLHGPYYATRHGPMQSPSCCPC